ncbi:MAG: hypothetical protein MK161_03465 [Pirellulales bacterium]|nr:hypothetical protein [Pirellulales bacterium]
MWNLYSLRQSICIFTPLICGLLSGCHGGPKTDVIERELRWQEDQIYALEDYLMEYQAKVRRLRCENETLRQSLAKAKTLKIQEVRETLELPSPVQPDETIRPERSLLNNSNPANSQRDILDSVDLEIQEVEVPVVPQLGVPDTPDLPENTSPRSPDLHSANSASMETAAEPAKKPTPDRQLSNNHLAAPSVEPDFPPWITVVPSPTIAEATETAEFSSPLSKEPTDRQLEIPWNRALKKGKQTDSKQTGTNLNNHTIQGTFEAAWDGEKLELLQTPQPVVPIVDPEVSYTSFQPTNMLLEVDLDANREQLNITITPLAANQESTDFTGTVSLMLRDPQEPTGSLHDLQWDFDSDQVQNAWIPSSRKQALHFRLPLPETLPTSRPVEFWVRLMATSLEGPTKILDHIVLQPASFPKSIPVRMENDWAIARPGAPSLLEPRMPNQIKPDWQATDAPVILR